MERYLGAAALKSEGTEVPFDRSWYNSSEAVAQREREREAAHTDWAKRMAAFLNPDGGWYEVGHNDLA